jgi:hypothetical protein
MPGIWNVCHGKQQSQPRREATWLPAICKTIRARLPKIFGAHIMPPYAPNAGKLQEIFTLLDFGLVLVQSFLVILLFLPFRIGIYTLYHCVLEVCNCLFFIEAHRVCLEDQRRL